GATVLTRQARGVSPTAAGAVLYERAVQLLDLADGVVQEVREVALTPTIVRVGAFSTAAQFLLPAVLSKLLTTHPGLEVVLIDREPPEGFADVRAGRLDVTITHCYSGIEPIEPQGLGVETLLRDPLVLLVPTGHSAVDGVKLDALADERWVSGPPEAQNHIALEWAAAHAGFVPEVAFETTDYAVTMTLVANGLGPAFVPQLILDRVPDGVRRVELADDPGLERVISLVYREPVRSDTLGLVLDELRAVGRAAAMVRP
ncbi:MAG: LysR substrate-binding domain-containing protein, partial [Ilumatobacter sp.]